MSVSVVDFIVEEPSAEAFLRAVLPGLLGSVHFNIYPFQGKDQLFERLPARLRGYAAWIPEDYRIVVLVDADDDDCRQLKARLEAMAEEAGLTTKSRTRTDHFVVLNRIAVEELEAWYFGDWDAVRTVYPRVPATVPNRASFRDPDAIPGGAWERFEQVLQRVGYFKGGLRKIEAAQMIGPHIAPPRNRSHSFQVFCAGLQEIIGS